MIKEEVEVNSSIYALVNTKIKEETEVNSSIKASVNKKIKGSVQRKLR
jgi:hypothetical protein